ncbi:hypothetical protein [Clostridium saccharobutylicum]|uniref:Uncharacterized protein n=1 Tax=Clostridium saccharobutylicum DSM 13864 TaxID=1345695 RepID=U5MX25_CLOSA|nr:hypothetical protein [Clostridium saccharobutylicum]AGX43987.1 hypothetical protein CLSA_c30200 [Clostridium saccharobutylicum DSM 13864]AQR91283.1 hypothetical protein CLOSC_30070 [Clostridium saccharobutylicum]AQS01187.1 hypothetical protein CSACC_30140 [Clostridium saccharobutylicum]AQS15170.1 hypothetical protein CLOSACC_30140 [Clostridium saccharobutylicum]MBA2905297.1 hypothetical protein [Clostridium saccharobutylicum]
MSISLKQLNQKAAAVSCIVKDITVARVPKVEDLEDLERNFEQLYSMILDVGETLDAVLSDIEK